MLRIFLRQAQAKELTIAILQMGHDGGLSQVVKGEGGEIWLHLDPFYILNLSFKNVFIYLF